MNEWVHIGKVLRMVHDTKNVRRKLVFVVITIILIIFLEKKIPE